jgi:hypothetical protein
MRKSYLTAVLAAGLTTGTLAIAAPDPLAEITPEGCSFIQVSPFGTSLLGSWSWLDGTSQTKFGGDAEFTVNASIDDGVTWNEFDVEFEVVTYEPGTPAEEYAGQFVYRCSTAETAVEGQCNGAVLGLRAAIRNAAAMQLGVLPEEITNLRASLDGVGIKAMNPGTGAKRQNYPKVDICMTEL